MWSLLDDWNEIDFTFSGLTVNQFSLLIEFASRTLARASSHVLG
jgi:hypothetical protein